MWDGYNKTNVGGYKRQMWVDIIRQIWDGYKKTI